MPWNSKNYPDSFKNLTSRTRNKAIEIANSLLEEDYNENRAISIAIKKAKEWDSNRRSKSGEERHIIPQNGGWAIVKSEGSKPIKTFDKKNEALDRAKTIAGNNKATLVIHKQDGSIQDKIEYR